MRLRPGRSPGAPLATVYGRRLQGKSFLLTALCEQLGGLYFHATEDLELVVLGNLARTLSEHSGAVAPLALPDWQAAINALMRLGEHRPVTVVLDESPYLLRSSRSLPSVLQAALGPRRRQRMDSRTRLILCGSALRDMQRLVSEPAPLRGKTTLNLAVQTFDFREARSYWGVTNTRLAALLLAVVGGTPAYKDMLRGSGPSSEKGFDDWVCRTVLDPSSPLRQEARSLFAEDLPDAREPSLFHSILGAVASGATTPGEVASRLGRASSDLNHAFDVLEDVGLLAKSQDAVFDRKPHLRVREPLLAFYYTVMLPVWPQLDRPAAVRAAWQRQRAAFSSQVLGPHFEQLCRDWAGRYASPATFGADQIHTVGQLVISQGKQSRHEIDVAVTGAAPNGPRRLISIARRSGDSG